MWFQNSRFKLPRNGYYFCSRNNAGNLIEVGLPNITGKFRIIGNQNAYGADNFSGAFISEDLQEQGNYTLANSGNANIGVRYINFDASRSSSIYGNSTTIQPLSVSCYLEFYLN